MADRYLFLVTEKQDTGFRTGDDAPMAVIELVDRDINAKKVDKPKKTESTKKDKETLPKTASK